MGKRIAWQVLVWVTAALAVWGTRKITRSVWTRVSHSENPANPFDESTTWQETVSMAAVVALVAALARRLARRGAEKIWKTATGEAPPGAVTL
ncbi:MAG: DUF4235 domain-containing protein [Acidimicrobiia bacterium]|jgi:hypothetical protein